MKTPFLLENHDVFCQALAFVLEEEPDLEVDGLAGTLEDARRLIEEHIEEIDLAVVDLLLPDGAGVDLIRELHQRKPEVPILVVTVARDREVHEWARAMRATEVLNKDVPLEEIVAAIRRLGGE